MELATSAAQKLGKNDECITLYEKYLEISPKAKDANGVICTIAVLYQQAGNKEKAKEFYQKIVNDPQYGPTAQEQLELLAPARDIQHRHRSNRLRCRCCVYCQPTVRNTHLRDSEHNPI
jgi:tetratricopeptide (TPR) repeat protein